MIILIILVDCKLFHAVISGKIAHPVLEGRGLTVGLDVRPGN